jgi:hypothetical protein
MSLLSFVPNIIDGVTGYLGKREARKTAKLTINGKLSQAKQDNSHEVVLNRQEWESIGQIKQDSTWKDEFVTVVILWPYVQIFLGGLEVGFLGTNKLLTGLESSLTQLNLLGIETGYLMTAVVLAAIGIRFKKS